MRGTMIAGVGRSWRSLSLLESGSAGDEAPGKLETKLSNLSLATYCADFRDGVASEPQPRRLTRGSISTTASARRQIPRAPQAPQGTRRAEVCVNWDTHIVISFHAHMTLTSMRLMPADRRIALERGGSKLQLAFCHCPLCRSHAHVLSAGCPEKQTCFLLVRDHQVASCR